MSLLGPRHRRGVRPIACIERSRLQRSKPTGAATRRCCVHKCCAYPVARVLCSCSLAVAPMHPLRNALAAAAPTRHRVAGSHAYLATTGFQPHPATPRRRCASNTALAVTFSRSRVTRQPVRQPVTCALATAGGRGSHSREACLQRTHSRSRVRPSMRLHLYSSRAVAMADGEGLGSGGSGTGAGNGRTPDADGSSTIGQLATWAGATLQDTAAHEGGGA